MSENWKPGDVAMVLNEHRVWNVAICTLRAGHRAPLWRYGVADSWMSLNADARRLVVIDPEDREQVERLADALITAMCKSDRGWDKARAYEVRSHMRAALHEFAVPTPPRPDEPTGLGAVVESDDGCRFIRQHDGWWRGDEPCTLNWAAVHAVRVLSEGVPS